VVVIILNFVAFVLSKMLGYWFYGGRRDDGPYKLKSIRFVEVEVGIVDICGPMEKQSKLTR